MKPPICDVCGRRFDTDDGGGLVYFQDAKSLPDGMTGHPDAVEWYCKRHYDAAYALRESTYAEAMQAMNKSPFSLLSSLIARLRNLV